jgi:hypothetical protein
LQKCKCGQRWLASLWLMHGTTREANIYRRFGSFVLFWYFELKVDSCFVQLWHVANGLNLWIWLCTLK